MEQKIASLKYKDFIFQEEKYFDWVNLLIKIILSLSSFVFLLYGCLNIKWIRKQFSNEQISKKNMIHKNAFFHFVLKIKITKTYLY
ncbi:hypothetical protein BHE82_01620 [Rice orange leaf phytoplasma]|nr:hypothetical protein BHE82_01620 [Rice orange leaf phytoplasma]